MENNQNQNIDLPENAFRELKDGEEYKPVMSPQGRNMSRSCRLKEPIER